jgi:hypothetical protein
MASLVRNRRANARTLVRNADMGALHETFLVTAVVTIIVIRTQLWLTNYPQLGGRGLHIAHLLWGGLFMLVALGLLLSYVGRSVRHPSAIVGGVGFGFFIDELGKFITSDNNYFFKPAAALIYLIFVGLFLLTRKMEHSRGLQSGEYVANALEMIGEAARQHLDSRERRRALEMVDRADPRDPLVKPLRALLGELETIPPQPPRFYTRWAADIQRRYVGLIERPWFPRVLNWLFVFWALLSSLTVFELALDMGLRLGDAQPGYLSDRVGDLSFVNYASMISSLVAAGFVIHGVVRMTRGDRYGAYDRYHDALLVSIFVTQTFSFVESQFGAVFGLAIDLLLLVTVRYLMTLERRRKRAESEGTAAAPVPALETT